MKGLAQLQACMTTLLTEMRGEVRGLRELVETSMQGADMTRPLTTAELFKRWQVPGATQKAKLGNLAKKCALWGLRPQDGTRGMSALYQRADVVHAEAFAARKIHRRRHAA